MSAITDHYNELRFAYLYLERSLALLNLSHEERKALSYTEGLNKLDENAFERACAILNVEAERRYVEELRELAAKHEPLPPSPIRFGASGYSFGGGFCWNCEMHEKTEPTVIWDRAIRAVVAEVTSLRDAAESEFKAYALAVSQGVAVAPKKE